MAISSSDSRNFVDNGSSLE